MSIGNGLSVIVGLPRIATWNEPGRPRNPKTGTIGFNTEAQKLEIWNGTVWYTVISNPIDILNKDLQRLITSPKLSKNSPTYLSIGNGLSVIVGPPRIATWNTQGKPKKTKTGMLGFNTETQELEIWNGTVWYTVPMKLL